VRSPTLRLERELLRAGATLLASVDEVGRGALAGPVAVGVVVIDASTPSAPTGVRDSKLLSPEVRESLRPRIERWAIDSAVGSATPGEIDRWGLTAALRLAGERALADLGVEPDLVLLDGSHDWLTRRASQGDLFDEAEPELPDRPSPRVVTRVKADLTCASVAAASVLAKVSRDAHMAHVDAQFPQYRWRDNKGYASPEHQDALRDHGPCDLHRRSWNLPSGG